MRILVTGWDGLLGRSLVPRLRGAHEVAGFGVGDGDIADPRFLAARFDAFRPDRVVHLAAFTAVDRAEAEPGEAFRVNEEGSRRVAEAAAARGLPVVAVSTDYVFDGRKSTPYDEDDAPNPLGVYGRSKLAGEAAIRAAGGAWAIVRTAWLYGPGGPNFVETILRLVAEETTVPVVDDQTGSPTYAPDLAGGLCALLERNGRGLYHMAGAGAATWCGLARAAVRGAGFDPDRIRPATTADIGRPAPRPARSALSCERARRELGVALRPWGEALEEYLRVRAGRGGGPDR